MMTPEIKDSEGKITKHAFYQVEQKSKSFGCDSCLANFVFTLDNAKYWYLNIIYNGLYKCLNMDAMYFIEGDTDSQTWVIAGNPD
jgi:hypothetical protein